jgi:glycosyltransferase involved in cell wall biosynthesis
VVADVVEDEHGYRPVLDRLAEEAQLDEGSGSGCGGGHIHIMTRAAPEGNPRGGDYATPVRVLLADPPAFTPPYDHELAAALARAGADVELVTSRFRFGRVPAPAGYGRSELFYPLSSRLFRRSPLRIPLKLLEHPLGMTRLARRDADVVHLQWLAVPELDRFLLRRRRPTVFTAHDLLPRRTAHKVQLWRSLYRRFDRIVVHSERAQETLTGLGVARERLRVVPHPVFRREVRRDDDGRTVLFSGVIRPYKGHEDAVEAVRRVDGARLLVVGDRVGYVSDEEIDSGHEEATIAVFPYRPEIDQSGALMRALGAGVPAVVYDVCGLPEPVRAFGAGRIVPAGDVGALAGALRELLADEGALAEARTGAERARDALTWEAAAAAHLELYEEIL